MNKQSKRINLVFSDSQSIECDKIIFEQIKNIPMAKRTEFHLNAYRCGVLLSKIDRRIIQIFPVLCAGNDIKRAFIDLLKATDTDVNWLQNHDFAIVGYRKRVKLSNEVSEILNNGWSSWSEATREEFELFQANKNSSIEIEAIYRKTSTKEASIESKPVIEPIPEKKEEKQEEKQNIDDNRRKNAGMMFASK